MIKLVLADVDGTLLPEGKAHVSVRTRRAIARLRAAGVRFGLATGRDRTQLMRIFEGDAAALTCGLFSNGKEVVVDGELRHLALLDREGLVRLTDFVRDMENTCVCVYPLATDESNPVFCLAADGMDVDELARRYVFTPTAVEEVPDVDVISATIACGQDQAVLDEIKRTAAARCPEFDFVQPLPHWCDVVPRGINKGTALPLLLSELGIKADEVVFFGDAENDLALLMSCGHPVAVANATAPAAAAARYHIGDVASDAVACAIEELADAALAGTLPGFMREGDAR